MKQGIVITTFSTASAVGKTFLTVNMAAEMARLGFRTCILDLDFQFGDVTNYLRLKPQMTIYNYQEDYQQKNDIDVNDYLVHYNDDLLVLAAPREVDEGYVIDKITVTRVLEQVRQDFDYIFIDTLSGFSEINLAVMDISSIISFMGIVDFVPTIKNMKIGYDTMLNNGYAREKIRFILNLSNAKTHIEVDDVEKLLEGKFYHILPNDFASTIRSIQHGKTLSVDYADTELGRSVRRLVAKYLNRATDDEPENNKPKAGGWLKKIFS